MTIIINILEALMSDNKLENSDLYSSQKGFLQSSSQKPLIPICMISSHLVNKLRTEIIPEIESIACSSVTEKAIKYQQLYKREFQENQKLNNALAHIIDYRNQLAERYNGIKRMKSTDDAVRRKRRYARDIERLFYCPIQRCKRGYGSEGSLSHHVRLKHLQFYDSGNYEIFIQKYIDSLGQAKKEELVKIKQEYQGDYIRKNKQAWEKKKDNNTAIIKVQQK